MTTAPSPILNGSLQTIPDLSPSDAYRALLRPRRLAWGRFLKWVGVLSFLAYLVYMGELAAEAALCYGNGGHWNRKTSACNMPVFRIELTPPKPETDMGPVL